MSSPVRKTRWRSVQIPFNEPVVNKYDDNELEVVKLRESRLDMSRVVLYYPADDPNRTCLDLDTGEIITIRASMTDTRKLIEATPLPPPL